MDAERIVRELAERIAMEHYVQNPITRAAGLAKDIEKGLAPVRALITSVAHDARSLRDLLKRGNGQFSAARIKADVKALVDSLDAALAQLDAAGKDQP